MTDNRTTELLRELLDERGIEWDERSCPYYFFDTAWKYAKGAYASFTESSDGTTFMILKNVTPEQAIAATLGSEREAKLIRAMEDVLRHATDTVWVSEIETLVDRMVSLGVYGCEVYEGARPWEVDR